MKENRYSQKKLCEICGITEAAFSRYMTSGRMPRTDVLANIANTLHTTSDYLLGNDAHYGYDQLKILLAGSISFSVHLKPDADICPALVHGPVDKACK